MDQRGTEGECMKTKTSRNCKECGGLLRRDGSCSKCEEANRIVKMELDLFRCQGELDRIHMQSEGKFMVRVEHQVYHGLSSEAAKSVMKALLDAGIRYATIGKDQQ